MVANWLFVTLLKFVEGVLLSSVNLGIQYQYSGTKYESRCASNHPGGTPELLKTAKNDGNKPP